MDKNLLLAVALSIAVYALWFGLIEKHYVNPAPRTPTAASMPAANQAAAAKSGEPLSAPERERTTADSSPDRGPADRKAIEAEAEPLADQSKEIRIHPQGAAIVSCRYRGPLGAVELVHDPTPGLFATWPELRFSRENAAGGATLYSASRPDGMRIFKEYLPEGPATLPRIRVRLVNPTAQPLESGVWTMNLGPGLDTVPSEMKENASVWRAVGLLAGEKGSGGKIEAFKPGAHAGPYRWAGIDNRYFLAAVLPAPGDFSAIESASPPRLTLRALSATIPPRGERAWEIPYYLGAKGQTWLTQYRSGLERSIDFGFFAQLGRFVIKVLNRIHRLTGNWGWAIVLMTFLIQALLFPLTYKSMKAMAVMKKLQPDISRLQQKYGKDQQRLNAEMMELYKKSGANPLGGCLPLLLQMPVFIALFNAMRSAWELHGAPWMFWVRDLSAKDPYYVLPIVMGGVMFLQNRMNPAATTDPTQKTMMTWMPVIFTFMFLSTPAGLVLYWLTSSIISAGIQVALKRKFEQS
ncbi:MAG TPA: hypothetical protein DEB40_11100 [Elusimicrobia bacterium]|nr:hypothetical protein [Elusimicrobiota bacterium]HBT62278.1 hypothetical protein [Elusimicrobiota bacterium]